MTEPTGTPSNANVSFLLDADLLVSFREVARSHNRTVSGELRELVRKAVEAPKHNINQPWGPGYLQPYATSPNVIGGSGVTYTAKTEGEASE